jgi:primase-polymerase (primpol)-like protein
MTALPTADQFPSDLLGYDHWVCWQTEERGDTQTKVPVNPSTGRYASTTDPETWTSFAHAREYAHSESSVSGLGFVFTDADPFVGIDLDDCRSGDDTAPWASDIIDRLDSYTELSPSGTGYHVIVEGTLPDGPNRRANVECYETARYFTMTGESEHGPPRPIRERSAELAAIHADYVAIDDSGDSTPHRNIDPGHPPSGSSTPVLEDETVIEKALNAKNSDKFQRLWNGSTGGYDSHSEADMALCFHLAFWTGGNASQVDRLFRRSGLLRQKWDEVHFSDGSTYGEKTVERAIERVDEFYDPPPTNDRSAGRSSEPPDRRVPPTDGSRQRSNVTHSDSRLLNIIDRLETRVGRLERENEALRQQLKTARTEQETPRPDLQSSEASAVPETRSIWDALASRFRSRDE